MFFTKRIEGDYDARSVANWFIRKSIHDDKPKTQLQIMKLVYFSHAWMLGIYGRPLISQTVKAWKYGPVVPTLYQDLKHWGNRPIERLIEGYTDTNFDSNALDILRQVDDVYGDLDAWHLSSLTHIPESPWFVTRVDKYEGATIADELIQDYFSQRTVDA